MQVHIDSSRMKNLKAYEIELSEDKRHSPPPSVNPATPTPGIRPPTTLTPAGPSIAYTSSQMRPAPTSTVPDIELTFVSLKRDMEICTPIVEENPGFVACPPPFTAKGVRVDPRIRSYEYAGGQMLVCRIRLAYYLAHVFGAAWLHRTSRRLGTRGSTVFNVEQVLRCGLITHQSVLQTRE